jgi:predicted nicotinamide N-methyase
MNNDDEAACFADMGFMFEGAEPSILEKFEWIKGNRIVKVTLKRADGDPGAVQSGHYLWPAAPALAEHLLERDETPTTILELGAGCALLSLTALQVFSNLQCLVTTDHDPGTLDRAKDNHEITCEEVFTNQRLLEQIIAVPTLWEPLSWGDEDAAMIILGKLQCTVDRADAKFDMILGSDLIYDFDVAKPLLLTVAALMNKINHARFIMSQSFPYDDVTETEIDNVCASLGLQRTKITDNLQQKEGVRIQEFHWK